MRFPIAINPQNRFRFPNSAVGACPSHGASCSPRKPPRRGACARIQYTNSKPGEFKGNGVVAAKAAGSGAEGSAAIHPPRQHAASHANAEASHRDAHAPGKAGRPEAGRDAAARSAPNARAAVRARAGKAEHAVAHPSARAQATAPRRAATDAAYPPATRARPTHATPSRSRPRTTGIPSTEPMSKSP